MKVFPIFLNTLHRERSVVIGGDHEAERKVGSLLECDANVTVIHPTVTPKMRTWVEDDAIEWLPRDYRRGDLDDAFLVIISETNPERTRPIWEEAQEKKVLINAMDDVPHCTFVAGSVVRRGPLVVSISTSGCAPALSVRIREDLEEKVGPEHAEFLELSRALREPMAEHYPDFDTRRDVWYDLVDSDVLNLLRQGRRQEAYARIDEVVGFKVAHVLASAATA